MTKSTLKHLHFVQSQKELFTKCVNTDNGNIHIIRTAPWSSKKIKVYFCKIYFDKNKRHILS